MDSLYVYALGTVNARFPNISLEKEFTQAASAQQTQNLTDRRIQYEVFTYTPSQPPPTPPMLQPYYPNRYIARDMCWVFTIENVDTYILQPRTDDELNQLIAMLNEPVKTPLVDVDVVIGSLGPIAPPEMCNGLQIPIVVVNNTYSFKVDDFINNLPKRSKPLAIPEPMVKQLLRN